MNFITQLKSYQTITNTSRSSAIDVYRGIAIISVVLFHYNRLLPLGYLGVDLFFVVSGYLVGGILINYFEQGRIPFWKFILQRGFKIWPSYFFFLIVGNVIAYCVFNNSSHNDYYIPLAHLKRYVLFYRNYTGEPHHWDFDHLWSLCVEEHFYLLMPLALMAVLMLFKKPNLTHVYYLCYAAIALGFLAKIIMLYYSNGKDTYSATHNRVDALAYGVLLHLLIQKYKTISISKSRKCAFLLGVAGTVLIVVLHYTYSTVFYNKVVLHSFAPLCFALIMFGAMHINFSKWFALRFIAYYSYNIYLWHPLVVCLVTAYFGTGTIGFLIYFPVSLLLGIIATLLIEEPFLKLKNTLQIKS